MGSTNFCRFRDQNSHRFRDQGSNFWVKIWDQLRKNIPRYDPDLGTNRFYRAGNTEDSNLKQGLTFLLVLKTLNQMLVTRQVFCLTSYLSTEIYN